MNNLRNPISPFGAKVKPRKTIYYLESEDDIMDLGSWVESYFFQNYPQCDEESLDNILFFIYGVINFSSNNLKNLSIMIEEGKQEKDLYLSFLFAKDFPEDYIENIKTQLSPEDFKSYDNMIYFRATLSKRFEMVKFSFKTVKDNEKEILRQEHSKNVVSADEYMEKYEDDMRNNINQLSFIHNQLEERTEELITKFNEDNLKNTAQSIVEYSKVLEKLEVFSSLSYTLLSLGKFLQDLSDEIFVQMNHKKVGIILESIKIDLSSWRMNVFVSQSADNIYYLDSSLLSSFIQLEALISSLSIVVEGEDEEIELF